MAVASMTIAGWMETARQAGADRLDAHLLLTKVLARSRSWLIAHDEEPLTGDQVATLDQLLTQRVQGIPMAYLLGEREFHGLTLKVTPDVLDPRPDTETLVDWALEILPTEEHDHTTTVLDLGTGSGAIALALKAARPHCQVWATDISPVALRVAQENAQRLGLEVTFSRRNWLEGLTDQRFDLIVSNPPYIDAHDPHLVNLHAEPRSALTPGVDGLRDLRTLVRTAGQHLRPGGWLLLEHGWNQAQAVCQELAQAGFAQVTTRQDLSGHHRCSGGRWQGAPQAS